MKKTVFILLTAILFGCAKEPMKKECELRNTGTLIFSNETEDTYKFYLNDIFICQLTGGKKYTLENVKSGEYTYKIQQMDGYVLYPSVGTGQFSLFQCEIYNIYVRPKI